MIQYLRYFWSGKLRSSDQSKLRQPQDLWSEDEPSNKEELIEVVLKQVLQKKEFSILDGLNEYDEDYTFFESRGAIITHEMKKRMLNEVLLPRENSDAVVCENENKWQDQGLNQAREEDDQQSG
ncbi:MAG: hypothetical protein QF470_00200 [Methylococcales bacterium]|jgi:hypothetical protein|nr:hypothetical protein [Methylococcales bacterium]